ncbi:GNAT family N-acetyltransferase [Pseudoalteromonas sp. SMS1]|uniref:GNAT family N-acetyltransferase n=1 Tax=Pseudoalteromonas sp. SMS1 TaxID=2908894 RepID=UPI001F463A1F|nr:GNAT family N-acetyltransferase [Pseudoalteromonas sp. SMS1]MCF2855886.1 GNAT family N-acetyltransferase [Pseudoalteromonas sp. SMS1]
MEIRLANHGDIALITDLISAVSSIDVLPHFGAAGKHEYMRRVLPDIESTLNTTLFDAFIALKNGQIIGFAALREKNYITHLFVAKSTQRQGVGKILLNTLLAQTRAAHISLRASVNARCFYEKAGFKATEPEGQFCGIRFIPMALERGQLVG